MMHPMPANKDQEQYNEREAQRRFEAALKSALNTPHTPLREKPKVRTVKKATAKKR
jgi:hypothetical protein